MLQSWDLWIDWASSKTEEIAVLSKRQETHPAEAISRPCRLPLLRNVARLLFFTSPQEICKYSWSCSDPEMRFPLKSGPRFSIYDLSNSCEFVHPGTLFHSTFQMARSPCNPSQRVIETLGNGLRSMVVIQRWWMFYSTLLDPQDNGIEATAKILEELVAGRLSRLEANHDLMIWKMYREVFEAIRRDSRRINRHGIALPTLHRQMS